jgi:predicted enzyme related to lactoylglutathione lyase
MRKVTGIGGVFFRARDPAALAAWYAAHLGLPVGAEGNAMLRWCDDGDPEALTVWSPFAADTDYFGRPEQQAMINFRVADLGALLAALAAAGIAEVKPREDFPYGRFAWIDDPEGNRIELWEPPRAL